MMCDNWVVLKVKGNDPHYRLLRGWSGGYATGDSWHLNSGITGCTFDGEYYTFKGSSGSTYSVYLDSYGVRFNIAGVIEQFSNKNPGLIEVMPEDTNWSKQDWIIT